MGKFYKVTFERILIKCLIDSATILRKRKENHMGLHERSDMK